MVANARGRVQVGWHVGCSSAGRSAGSSMPDSTPRAHPRHPAPIRGGLTKDGQQQEVDLVVDCRQAGRAEDPGREGSGGGGGEESTRERRAEGCARTANRQRAHVLNACLGSGHCPLALSH